MDIEKTKDRIRNADAHIRLIVCTHNPFEDHKKNAREDLAVALDQLDKATAPSSDISTENTLGTELKTGAEKEKVAEERPDKAVCGICGGSKKVREKEPYCFVPRGMDNYWFKFCNTKKAEDECVNCPEHKNNEHLIKYKPCPNCQPDKAEAKAGYFKSAYFNKNARIAFAEREQQLKTDKKWPLTKWYNDEDFCEVYKEACDIIDRLQATITEQAGKIERLEKNGYVRHKSDCFMGEYNSILVGEGCTCGLSQALNREK